MDGAKVNGLNKQRFTLGPEAESLKKKQGTSGKDTG